MATVVAVAVFVATGVDVEVGATVCVEGGVGTMMVTVGVPVRAGVLLGAIGVAEPAGSVVAVAEAVVTGGAGVLVAMAVAVVVPIVVGVLVFPPGVRVGVTDGETVGVAVARPHRLRT